MKIPAYLSVFTLSLGVLAPFLQAQNLVPNPGFEEYTQRPCSGRIEPPDNIGNYLNGWYAPTLGSTDIFTSDSSTLTTCTNDVYTRNYTVPHGGKYQVGVFTSARPGAGREYREYIQVQLLRPLMVGKIYYAEMYVSPLRNSVVNSNNMGMHFSLEPDVLQEALPDIGNPLLRQPQVNQTAVIAGINSWHKVSGCFVADKPYRYLTLGNFFSDAQTKFSPTAYDQPTDRVGAYYFIDDVVVAEAGSGRLAPSLTLRTDTTLCPGQSWTIAFADTVGVRYRWQDGLDASAYTISRSGTYRVTANAGLCQSSDSVRVLVEAPVTLPADTAICQGESLFLTARHPSQAFLWNDGSRDSTLTVTQTGVYWVRASSQRCFLGDTIQVDVLECPGMVPNVFTPNGDGRNDAFVIENIEQRPWRMTVYNRWGQIVYQTAFYRNDWKGSGLPAGTYYYQLSSAELKRELKGWVELLR